MGGRGRKVREIEKFNSDGDENNSTDKGRCISLKLRTDMNCLFSLLLSFLILELKSDGDEHKSMAKERCI